MKGGGPEVVVAGNSWDIVAFGGEATDLYPIPTKQRRAEVVSGVCVGAEVPGDLELKGNGSGSAESQIRAAFVEERISQGIAVRPLREIVSSTGAVD